MVDRSRRVSSRSADPLTRRLRLSTGEHCAENLQTPMPPLGFELWLTDQWQVLSSPGESNTQERGYCRAALYWSHQPSDARLLKRVRRMTTPLEPWMRLGAMEWIVSTWSEHRDVDSAVHAGLVTAFQHAQGPEFDLSQYQTLFQRGSVRLQGPAIGVQVGAVDPLCDLLGLQHICLALTLFRNRKRRLCRSLSRAFWRQNQVLG